MAKPEQIDELITKMSEERSRLIEVLASLDETTAEYCPRHLEGEGQWSAKQQSAHLTEMETAYRGWVEAALGQDNPDVTAVRGDPVAIPLEKAHDHPLSAHLAALDTQRTTTLELIRSLEPADFERTATHKWFGSLTVMQWLRSYYRHDRMHVDQLSGREPEYKPNFTTGVEPDQRRAGSR
ncbi:MAG: DinB family protein [Dehalococcoidia bacterium]